MVWLRGRVACAGLHTRQDQRAGRTRRNRLTRTNPLQAFDYDPVAGGKATDNGGNGGRRLAKLDAALYGLIVGANGEDVVALLVGQHRRTRDRQHLNGLDTFEHDCDEFAVGQFMNGHARGGRRAQDRVGDLATHGDRVGILGDRVVDEVQLAGLAIHAAIGQSQPEYHGFQTALWSVTFAQFEGLAQRHREGDVHRILADDRGQY